MLVSERDLQLLVPAERSAARIRLREREPRHLAVRGLEVRRDRRPPGLVDPRAAPGGEVFVGARVEDRDEIGPRRVARTQSGVRYSRRPSRSSSGPSICSSCRMTMGAFW